MASIERTAYPRFRRSVTARELAGLSPTEDEVVWARERTRSDEHLLALVLALGGFGRLGYVPGPADVPWVVVDYVRRCLDLPEGTSLAPGRLPRGSSAGWCASELLVKESLELPGFSTLDEMAGRIRREVISAIFELVAGRMGLPDRVRVRLA